MRCRPDGRLCPSPAWAPHRIRARNGVSTHRPEAMIPSSARTWPRTRPESAAMCSAAQSAPQSPALPVKGREQHVQCRRRSLGHPIRGQRALPPHFRLAGVTGGTSGFHTVRPSVRSSARGRHTPPGSGWRVAAQRMQARRGHKPRTALSLLCLCRPDPAGCYLARRRRRTGLPGRSRVLALGSRTGDGRHRPPTPRTPASPPGSSTRGDPARARSGCR